MAAGQNKLFVPDKESLASEKFFFCLKYLLRTPCFRARWQDRPLEVENLKIYNMQRLSNFLVKSKTFQTPYIKWRAPKTSSTRTSTTK